MNGDMVTKQHVVSQVVLSEFAVDGQLEVEDVRQPGRWRPKSPAAVGYIKHFVQHDSASTEALWQTVETRLPSAIREVRSGTAPTPGFVNESILRDCIALHWARSKAVKTQTDRSWLKVQAAHAEDLRTRRRPLLEAVYAARFGRPGTDEELETLNGELHVGPPEILDGRHFASRLPYFFEFAKDKFADKRIQVLICAEDLTDLVMSDCPVVAPKRRGPGLNPAQGVALGDAVAAGMPLGPRVYVGIHDASEVVEVNAAQVSQLNSYQHRVRDVQLFRRRLPSAR